MDSEAFCAGDIWKQVQGVCMPFGGSEMGFGAGEGFLGRANEEIVAVWRPW
jgi:hypothetical protein